MTPESLVSQDWHSVIARLGGAEALATSARETKAFVRPREIKTAVDLLRLILAYCLGEKGLRLTAAWAAAIGLVDISNVALLQRLRNCGDWLTLLIGQVLATAAPAASGGRLIRIIDATSVPQAGSAAKRENKLWRMHCAFDLPCERFGHVELTDEREGERLDRIPVVEGEIRLADAAHLQPDRMAHVLDQGGDFLVRAGWRNARWLDAHGGEVDIIAVLGKARERGLIDQPIWLGRKAGPPLGVRLVAVKKSPQAAAEARRKARRNAQREGYQLSKQALLAADWVILVTSLKPAEFTSEDILALYRLRGRIELAFKRLKSLVGLRGPPGFDERSAKPYLLAHLLVILLLEPLIDEFEDSPRLAQAA
jgi:Transposase DDE domain